MLDPALTLAWRPLIDPLPIEGVPDAWWYLALPPLLLGIAVVYKAVRIWTMRRYWSQVLKLFAFLLAGTLSLAAVLSFATFVAIG